MVFSIRPQWVQLLNDRSFFNQDRLAIYGKFTPLKGGNNLLHGCFLVIEGDINCIFLGHFMLDDSLRCLEDNTYPLAQASGGAAGNIQLHNSLRSVNSLHKKAGQQQEGDKGDESMFWEFHD
ncbi:hypothetical protein KKF55_06780 [Patescibacteria group bacterium]|nr:hypothetical protein [Patescibacteria group bacterium]